MTRGVPRRPARDSVAGRIAHHEAINADPPEPPKGFKLSSELEHNLWSHYTAARMDWRRAELVQIHDICTLSTKIAHEEDMLAVEGTIYSDRWGAPKPNPRAAIVASMRAQRTQLIRLLGVAQVDSPKTANSAAPTVGDEEHVSGTLPRGARKHSLLVV